MKRLSFLFLTLLSSIVSSAQLTYTLTYKDSSSSRVKISIQVAAPITAPVSFVMPRSIPGVYGISIYDNFVEHLFAINSRGEKIAMIKDANEAPRWYYTDTTSKVSSIEYEINLEKLERKTSPSDASIIRRGFAGILNYSVFGWIDGFEKQPVSCHVETFEQWPIFSSNNPSALLKNGSLKFNTENYYTLADGQIFAGHRFRVKEFKGLVPLFIVSYSQTEDEYLDDYGLQGASSMGILNDYFGELPFKQYSIMLIKALPLEPGSHPSLGMEHLQSSTFFGDTSGIRKSAMSKEMLIRTMPTFLHHMGHSLIPLNCYGDNYRPYPLEIPPIINNLFFNEGFMWFLPYDTLKLERMKTNFYNNVYKTSPQIKKLTLQQLSQTASTMYATDFRIGRSVYSRGALMAIEMDNYLKEKTGGEKSMKDIFRYLYQWTKQNKRPFTMEEFPLLLSKACNIDLSKLYKKWQLPVD
jgi:predicted metalloprotease with PDZ domain